MVPDLAGWRRERRPQLPDQAFFELSPDWICEILSPPTQRLDRTRTLPVYAHERVSHLWLVNPDAQTLEVMRLDGESYRVTGTYGGADVVHAEPFDAIELELTALWIKNRFILEEIIGRGGMGTIYKARDLRKVDANDPEPFIAIKVLNEDLKQDPAAITLLERETKNAQSPAHENIIKFFDFKCFQNKGGRPKGDLRSTLNRSVMRSATYYVKNCSEVKNSWGEVVSVNTSS